MDDLFDLGNLHTERVLTRDPMENSVVRGRSGELRQNVPSGELLLDWPGTLVFVFCKVARGVYQPVPVPKRPWEGISMD